MTLLVALLGIGACVYGYFYFTQSAYVIKNGQLLVKSHKVSIKIDIQKIKEINESPYYSGDLPTTDLVKNQLEKNNYRLSIITEQQRYMTSTPISNKKLEALKNENPKILVYVANF